MPRRKERTAPRVGATYTRTYVGQRYTMRVVEESGGIAYSVLGEEFKSPSAAAKAITKHEVNGWEFWGME